MVWLAVGWLLVVICAVVWAPLAAPHDPLDADLRLRLAPPAFMPGGTTRYLLGTDQLGRDILSRIIYGARISLVVGFGAAFVAGFIGVLLGLVSGYVGGWVDTVIMRLTDIVLSIPVLLLGMIVASVLGGNILNLILVLGAARWTVYARVTRGQVLTVRELQFITAARACGMGRMRILVRHILPNVTNPIIVISALEVANMILWESGLSYLGLGVRPPTPTWGNMLSDGRDYMMAAWWITTLPGLALFGTCVSLCVLGDRLRDVLDPSLRT